jgi:predicted homoserine dehydrogenase-like protein
VDRRYGIEGARDQNRPIRVGIVGAGFMCQGLTNQISTARLVCGSSRYPTGVPKRNSQIDGVA